MRIYRTADYQEMSRTAAMILAAQIQIKPDCVLGLATGSTPVGMYEELIRLHRAGLSARRDDLRRTWTNTADSPAIMTRAIIISCRRICLNM